MSEITSRGLLFPIGSDSQGNTKFPVMPQLLTGLLDAIGMAGNTIHKGVRGDPMFIPVGGQLSNQAIDELLNLSGFITGSPIAFGGKPSNSLGMGLRGLTKEDIDPLGYGKVRGLLNTPLDQTVVKTQPNVKLLPKKNLTIEDLQGSLLFPLKGDQSSAGFNLLGIDDINFGKPIDMQGGANFMRGKSAQADDSLWASNKSVVSDIYNRLTKLSDKQDKPINLVYTAMNKEGVDFATFPSSALAEQIPFSKILKKDKLDFDKKMKDDIKIGSDEHLAIKDWVGVDSPKLREFLEKSPAKVRKKFLKLMDTSPFQNAGFPSVAKTRYAVTDKDLLNARSGQSGYVIGTPDLSKTPSSNPLLPHGSYDTHLFGKYKGGLLDQVPRSTLWRDFYKGVENARTKSGKPLNPAMKDYKFSLDLPVQRVDQELVDTIMNLNK